MPDCYASRLQRLQCGHGPKAVENQARPAVIAASLVRFNAATARRPWRTRRSPAASAIRRCQRFNAATARRPWRTRSRMQLRTGCELRLQCGHGPKAVENARHASGQVTVTGRASMRPRPEGRGEPANASSACDVLVARLQCGHGPKAVENAARTCQRDGRPIGFNAATARRPWRTLDGRTAARTGSCTLQCGHGPKAVENTMTRRRRPAHCGSSFNAATARRPWRTCIRRCNDAAAGSASFNAATARRPWRTVPLGGGPARAAALQCGHGPKAVENQSAAMSRPMRPVALQCGHGPKAVENTRPLCADCRKSRPASMRPRPEGRGEPECSTGRSRTAHELQCGHDPKAVENAA